MTPVADQEPQGATSQLAIVQVTPEFVRSPVTTAVRGTAVFVSTVLGGPWVMLMEMGALTVNDVEALKLGLACAKAVRVMVVPISTGGALAGPGTVKLPVLLRSDNNPGGVQFTVPQVTFQSTPEFEGSPVTAATTGSGPV
jgi:hypothetical protein